VSDALAFDPSFHRITSAFWSWPARPTRSLRARCNDRSATQVTRTTALRAWRDGEHTLDNHAAERNAVTGDRLVTALR
jgi:hypothetical protein